MTRFVLTFIIYNILTSIVCAQTVEIDQNIQIRRDFVQLISFYNTVSDQQDARIYVQNADLNIDGLTDDLRITTEDRMRLSADSIVFTVGSSTPRTDFTFHHGFGTASEHGLTIENNSTNDHRWTFSVINNSGNLNLYRDAVHKGTFAADGVYTPSDNKLKKNIHSIGKVLPGIMSLSPKRYNYIEPQNSGKVSIGFIAQEVVKFFPELVLDEILDDGERVIQLNYSGFGVLAIKAIQEQHQVIESQQGQISQLELQMSRVLARLAELEKVRFGN